MTHPTAPVITETRASPPGAADRVIVVVLALVLAFDALRVVSDGSSLPILAVGVVTFVAVVLRRRAVVGLAIAAATFDLSVAVLCVATTTRVSFSLTAVLGLGVLAGTVARRARPRDAALAIALIAVALPAQYLPEGLQRSGFVLGVLVAAFLTGCVGLGVYLRWTDEQKVRIVDDARRSERLDLARDLHDVVAHYVSGIVVQAQAAQAVASNDPDVAGAALAEIERAGTDALTSMRQLVDSLRTDEPASRLPPGATGITGLVAEHEHTGPPVIVDADGVELDRLPPDLAYAVHRIVQESLTNVRKHGHRVSSVTIRLTQDDTTLTVSVHDDGRPHGRQRARRAGGYGLVGMQERAVLLGGTLTAGPDAAGGWTVTATLPSGGPRAA